MLITVQATLHILVNVGYLPVTGHTLPLLSLGGTSLVILSCAFGIILSVSRTIDVSSKNSAAPAIAAAPADGVAEIAPSGEEEERYEIMGPQDQFK
jgi:cell division protein FtsW